MKTKQIALILCTMVIALVLSAQPVSAKKSDNADHKKHIELQKQVQYPEENDSATPGPVVDDSPISPKILKPGRPNAPKASFAPSNPKKPGNSTVPAYKFKKK